MPDPNDRRETIKVTDRRAFTRDGTRREPEAHAAASAETTREKPAEPPAAIRGEGFTMEPPRGSEERATGQDPAFGNLVVSLYQSGLIHLGLVEEGEGDPPATDLDAARGAIEMLGMLKRKTLGNLSAEEVRILDALLAELQMTYATKASDV